MLLVSPRQVTSGYYRNNLYVLLGLNVLAALVVSGVAAASSAFWPTVVAAAVSYIGAVCWLYEKPSFGQAAIAVVAGADLLAARPLPLESARASVAQILAWVDPATGGLLLGGTMAAMLLGHWYLNAPGMPLEPLMRLIALLAVATVLRAVVCGAGLWLELSASAQPDVPKLLFLGLRWLGGLVGTAVLAVMAWQTMKVPNTQSATGILYVAVITTFLGELASGLLSAHSVYPL